MTPLDTRALHPALLLGHTTQARPLDALAMRVSRILETRPGTLPWEPEFGCDLDDLIGAPATTLRLAEVRWRIQAALARWLPELQVQRCEVRARRTDAQPAPTGGRDVPIAEAALLSLGSQAAVEVDLELETPLGPLALQAYVTP